MVLRHAFKRGHIGVETAWRASYTGAVPLPQAIRTIEVSLSLLNQAPNIESERNSRRS
jgi:hypothetical protein